MGEPKDSSLAHAGRAADAVPSAQARKLARTVNLAGWCNCRTGNVPTCNGHMDVARMLDAFAAEERAACERIALDWRAAGHEHDCGCALCGVARVIAFSIRSRPASAGTAVASTNAPKDSNDAARLARVEAALREAIAVCASGRRGHIGDHYSYLPQVSEATIERWRAALGRQSAARSDRADRLERLEAAGSDLYELAVALPCHCVPDADRKCPRCHRLDAWAKATIAAQTPLGGS